MTATSIITTTTIMHPRNDIATLHNKSDWQIPLKAFPSSGPDQQVQSREPPSLPPPTIQPSTIITEAIPNGGYGWTIITSCAFMIFWTNGWTSTWGVLQAALLHHQQQQSSQSSIRTTTPTSTLTFIGSLALSCLGTFGILSSHLLRRYGARNTTLLAVILFASGPLLTSFTLQNVGGIFVTAGLMVGMGASVIYTASNSLPVQWFSGRLGIANGLVKVGGGLGATVVPIATQGLINTVGLAWAFRVSGVLMLLTGIPCALLLRDRAVAGGQVARIDWRMMRNVPFLCLCLTGAIGTFALYVPPFFLPLFAKSIGLSASTGAALVASFGLSTTLGRLLAGFSCDKIGSLNTLSISMALNAISMLAIWPVSSTLAPLVVFAAINGVANGSFFVACPLSVARMVEPGRASIMMSLNNAFWAFGYLFGSPIAGVLISKTGAESSESIEPYRAAIFYAGGVAILGGAFVMIARLTSDRKVWKKL